MTTDVTVTKQTQGKAVDKNYVVSCLRKGIDVKVIAKSLDIDPDVLQRAIDKNNLMAEADPNSLTADLDARYDRVEAKMLQKLEQQLDFSITMKPGEIVNALSKLNALKRRSRMEGAAINENTTNIHIVQLNLPSHLTEGSVVIKPEAQKTVDNQIVAIEGRSLQTASEKTLQQMHQNLAKKREEEHKALAPKAKDALASLVNSVL